MRYVARSALSAILASVMITALLAGSAYSQRKAAAKPAAKAPASIYDQGYQKGYGDGFAQGLADWRQGAPRDFQSSDGFRSRDQKYDPRHAANGEYIEGYDLGFEIGHTDGYYGRARNAAVPANGAVLAKAAAIAANAQRAREQQPPPRDETNQRNDPPPQPVQSQGDNQSQADNRPRTTPTADIPGGTAMEIRLTSTINTKNNRSGDRFEAVVVSPDAYRDAVVEGHIANINRSGRVTGRTELALAFDRIRLQDGRELPLDASLEKIIESETVKKVDEEGNVQSGSRSKDAQMRGGVGAAAGAVIGGIIGGVKGAVLGAVIGGAGGVGTVYVEGDKDLVLEPGTEMIIRTERTRRR